MSLGIKITSAGMGFLSSIPIVGDIQTSTDIPVTKKDLIAVGAAILVNSAALVGGMLVTWIKKKIQTKKQNKIIKSAQSAL